MDINVNDRESVFLCQKAYCFRSIRVGGDKIKSADR